MSVVIPAYNRPDLLENAVRAIENQSLKGGFECIIVYGGDEKVREICEKKAKESKGLFSCFWSDTESPARKRNIGVKQASAPIIAFTDDDCVPNKNWLEEILVKFAEDDGIAGVEGLTYTEGKKEVYSNAPVNLKGGLFPTCNLSFRASVLQRAGGFDESYHFYREDTDIAFRAMEFGKVVFCEKAMVLHPQRRVGLLRPIETLVLLKEDVRLFKKMPEKYAKFLGKGFLADLAKVAASWFAFAMVVFGFYSSNIFFTFGGVLAYLVFWVSLLRGLGAGATELIVFLMLNFVRALAFPFYFLYYWAVVK